MSEQYDVIVIGGGASGMMAAGRAAERGLSVLLLEKNKRLGEKLRISGGGRCNITNAEYDERVLLKKYGKSEQFLYSLFMQFGVRETFVFFESRNLPLVVEEHKRAFPVSHNAEDVVTVLAEYMERGKVTVQYKSPVTQVLANHGHITGVVCGKSEYHAQEYIVATGSVSHPETGSTGDGLQWLRTLGHGVQDPTPTVVPLAVKDAWVHALAGVSLEVMKLTFFVDGKKAFNLKGKVLFTHFGISGPLILNSAHKVAELLPAGVVTAILDMFPDLDQGALEKKLLAIFNENKNKEFKNILKEVLPLGVQKGILMLLENHIDVATKVHSITKEERKVIAILLKNLPCTIEGLMGFDRAVVADGGIPLEEVDMRTMKSKKINNLFVTGDMLHINRPSGGFSLQLCWSTGYVAGSQVGKK